MPPKFEKGHPKYGGREERVAALREGYRVEQMAAHAFQMAGMTAEEIEKLTPLAIMRLVAAARMKVGDLGGALVAAEAAAPYMHPRLTSAEVKIDDEKARIEALSDDELAAEIAELERRIEQANRNEREMAELRARTAQH